MKKLQTLFLALLIACSGFGQTVLRQNDTVLRAYDANIPTSTPYTLAVWLDGKADQTFTLDIDSVDNWADKSGNGNDVSCASGTGQNPIYDVNTGRVTFIRANGTYLQSTAFGAALTQPNTVFIAFKNTGYVLDAMVFDGVSDRQAFYIASSIRYLYAGELMADGATDANDNIHVGLFNGVNSEYWINGISVGTGDVGPDDLDGITLGSRASIGQHADAELMEVIVFDGAISDTWRDKITAYLADKWSITATTDFKGYVIRQD